MSIEFGTSVPGIWKKPGLCGGDASIRGHRIPVWLLVSLRRQGATDAEILQDYPQLKLDDVTAAWTYYECYPDEIDRSIRENEEDEEGFVE